MTDIIYQETRPRVYGLSPYHAHGRRRPGAGRPRQSLRSKTNSPDRRRGLFDGVFRSRFWSNSNSHIHICCAPSTMKFTSHLARFQFNPELIARNSRVMATDIDDSGGVRCLEVIRVPHRIRTLPSGRRWTPLIPVVNALRRGGLRGPPTAPVHYGRADIRLEVLRPSFYGWSTAAKGLVSEISGVTRLKSTDGPIRFHARVMGESRGQQAGAHTGTSRPVCGCSPREVHRFCRIRNNTLSHILTPNFGPSEWPSSSVLKHTVFEDVVTASDGGNSRTPDTVIDRGALPNLEAVADGILGEEYRSVQPGYLTGFE